MADPTYEYIGYRDSIGNIYEEEVALDILDALQEDNEALTLTDVFDKVETTDYWQAEIDDQEENSPEPQWRFI